jgi:hypothetical protein
MKSSHSRDHRDSFASRLDSPAPNLRNNNGMTPFGPLAFLGEPGVTPASQLFIYMMMFVVPGIAVFGVGAAKEREGGGRWVKYVSLVFFGLGAWVGWPYTYHVSNEFLMAAVPIGGMSKRAYQLAFPGPVLLMLGVILYGVISARLRKHEESY